MGTVLKIIGTGAAATAVAALGVCGVAYINDQVRIHRYMKYLTKNSGEMIDDFVSQIHNSYDDMMKEMGW